MDSSDGNRPLILFAEDNLVSQKLFSMILDKLGYPSVMAVDGRDALEKMETSKAELVFLDINMPVMDGYEAAENLRKSGFKKPIIAVTASSFSEEKERCLKAGINDILIKPFNRIDVEKMLLKWINASGGTKEAAAEAVSSGPAADDVFNGAGMLATFMNDEEAVLPLLARFIERTQAQLENIPVLENNEDWERARMEAHMIKGAALTMGGTELGKAAARLELAYKNIDRSEMKAAYPLLREAFGRFEKKAEEFICSRS